ncbi:hypothetical protein BDY19DRAFT_942186, partial [Irpex rosettiformis]
MSNPKFWLKMFDTSLRQSGWRNDAVRKDPYAPKTVQLEAANNEYRQAVHSFLLDSLALRSLDAAEVDLVQPVEMSLGLVKGQRQQVNDTDWNDGQSHNLHWILLERHTLKILDRLSRLAFPFRHLPQALPLPPLFQRHRSRPSLIIVYCLEVSSEVSTKSATLFTSI